MLHCRFPGGSGRQPLFRIMTGVCSSLLTEAIEWDDRLRHGRLDGAGLKPGRMAFITLLVSFNAANEKSDVSGQ